DVEMEQETTRTSEASALEENLSRDSSYAPLNGIGFNTQKNSGLNLGHAYSHTSWAAYYFLLQIAHLLLQLVEKGSLLRHLAREQGKRTAVELFGSLKNMAQRLLDSLRYQPWPDEAFDRAGSGPIQIRLDSS